VQEREYKRWWSRQPHVKARNLAKTTPCKRCGQTVHTDDGDCKRCKNERARRRFQEQRIVCLRHYSGGTPQCACCNERTIEFLSLDHIEGGGTAHRREVGPSQMWAWLINHDFPDGFQILCHNCNLAKGFYGVCPHQATRPNP
jgi:hypothetical protein